MDLAPLAQTRDAGPCRCFSVMLSPLGIDNGAHPGMDAALKLYFFIVIAYRRTLLCGASFHEEIVRGLRLRDEVAIRKNSRALRPGDGVSEQRVQNSYKAAAKLRHTRERVGLAAAIHQDQLRSLFGPDGIGIEPPRPGALLLAQLGEEPGELRCAIDTHAVAADAGAGAHC